MDFFKVPMVKFHRHIAMPDYHRVSTTLYQPKLYDSNRNCLSPTTFLTCSDNPNWFFRHVHGISNRVSPKIGDPKIWWTYQQRMFPILPSLTDLHSCGPAKDVCKGIFPCSHTCQPLQIVGHWLVKMTDCKHNPVDFRENIKPQFSSKPSSKTFWNRSQVHQLCCWWKSFFMGKTQRKSRQAQMWSACVDCFAQIMDSPTVCWLRHYFIHFILPLPV